MIERHLHDFQVARFKVLQVFQVLLCCQVFLLAVPKYRDSDLAGDWELYSSFERFTDSRNQVTSSLVSCDLDVKLIVYCRSSFGLGLKRQACAKLKVIDGKDTCEKLVELVRREYK